MTNMLVIHMRHEEERKEGKLRFHIFVNLYETNPFIVRMFFLNFHYITEILDSGEADPGTRKSELIDWYLNEIQNDIDTEEELIKRKLIIEKVIDRLITQVDLLIGIADKL